MQIPHKPLGRLWVKFFGQFFGRFVLIIIIIIGETTSGLYIEQIARKIHFVWLN